jgi:subtilase family serine protease
MKDPDMIKRHAFAAAAVAMVPLLASAPLAVAGTADAGARTKTTPRGMIITPSSNLRLPGRASTNVELFQPKGRGLRSASPSGNFETPASLACVYGVTKHTAGCNPMTLTTVANGGGGMIAIVDAYDNPNAASDLSVYSQQFGLPPVTSDNFAVVYAAGTQPPQDPSGGWEVEESLDVDMAHGLAPHAKVVLVEAASAYLDDLEKAEKIATALVEAAGGGEVSNSWATGEFSTEAQLEGIFRRKHVVVFASAGDSPGPGVPAGLPDVISVGGTSIIRSASGDLIGEKTWLDTGGGLSAIIPAPAYQAAVANVVGTHRGQPDIAADANPETGVWFYDTVPYGGQVLDWAVVGGTSVASPATAAMINAAGKFKLSTTDELIGMYAELGNSKAFKDITAGLCGNNALGRATIGYDLCTGIGAPFGAIGK